MVEEGIECADNTHQGWMGGWVDGWMDEKLARTAIAMDKFFRPTIYTRV